MKAEGLEIVIRTIEKKIAFEKQFTNYNRKRIFIRAKHIMVSNFMTWPDALKQSWSESKAVVLRCRIELKNLQNQLLNILTPKKYEETTQGIKEAMDSQMLKAFSNGANLNR